MKVWFFAISLSLSVPVLAHEVAPGSYDLTSRHTSVYNKIDYRIPEGWVVIDGETDWIAPSMERQVGHQLHDPLKDPVYSVGVILSYLSVEDVRERKRASLEALARATQHSLEVAAGGRRLSEPRAIMLGGKNAYIIHMELPENTVLHQVFLELSDGRVGMAAGTGPAAQEAEITALVGAIAATIEPKATRRIEKKEGEVGS